MLIVFAGLPGVGKTTIARELARTLGAMHIRIDSIELALQQSGVARESLKDMGYQVAHAIADDNLRLGRLVIADCVNPWPMTRDAWLALGRRVGVTAVEVEVKCSDPAEHRRRVEGRLRETGASSPTWEQVVTRDYRDWERKHVVIDTAHESVAEIVARLHAALSRPAGSAKPL